jgi:hypothetical protein
MLYTAEALGAWAGRNLDMPVDADGLDRAWKLTFLNQFHDTLWGTINDASYREALQRATRVKTLCGRMIEDRLRPLLGRKSGEREVAVFNPLAWGRTAVLSVPLDRDVSGAKVFDEQGREYSARRVGDQLHWTADLSAAAVQTFRVETTTTKTLPVSFPQNEKKSGAFSVEWNDSSNGKGLSVRTPLYDVTFGPGGVMTSLKSKNNGVEFVDPQRPAFNALCYQTDRGDLWHYYDGPHSDGAPLGAEQEIMHDPYPQQQHELNRTGKRYFLNAIDNRNGPEAKFAVREMSDDRLVISITSKIARRFPNFPPFYNEEIRIDYT